MVKILKFKLEKGDYKMLLYLKRLSLLKIVIIISIFIFSLTVYFRFGKLSNELHPECWQFTGAISLHYLPIVFNDFSSHVLDNFWKFLFHGFHGLRDFVYYYLVIGIYDIIGLPITPHNIYVAEGILNLIAILVIFYFAYKIFSLPTSLLVMILLSMNSSLFNWGLNYSYQFSVMIFLPFLVYLAFYFLYTRLSLISTLLYLLASLYALGTEFIYSLPLYMFFIICVIKNEKKSKPNLRKLKELLYLLVALIAGLGMLFLQYIIYTRIGVSGLGLFGRIAAGYDPTSISIEKLSISIRNVNVLLLGIFSVKVFYFVFLAFIIFHIYLLIRNKIQIYSYINFIFLGSVYCTLQSGYTFIRNYMIIGYIGVFLSYYICYLYSKISKKNYIRIAFILAVLCVLILEMNSFIMNYLNYQVNPAEECYKTVGYYIRENGPGYSKVYNFGLDEVGNGSCEYYYGKNFMAYYDPGQKSKYFNYNSKLRKLIYSESTPFDSLLKYNKANKMDYYIFYKKYSNNESIDSNKIYHTLATLNYFKVAEIMNNTKVVAVIYTKYSIQFKNFDMNVFNRKWEEKYAHLHKIYEHRRVGMYSLWGHDRIAIQDIE